MQRLRAQQQAAEAALESAQQARTQRREILAYCLQVKERLHTFDMPRKRQALAALDIRVTWAPDEPIHIAGIIPPGITVPITAHWAL